MSVPTQSVPSAPDDQQPRQSLFDDEPRADFTRKPPQDLYAERSVLGGMLLSEDAVADVPNSGLKPRDFYLPAHQTIYCTVLDLYAKGQPADPITVTAALTKSGDLTRIGGAPYLHTLVESVPTAANAEYYAEIVHEKAVLRRLAEAGIRITQLGYAGEGEVAEIVQAAEAEVFAASQERNTAEDYAPVSTDVPRFMDALEARAKGGGKLQGISTGFTDLDSLTQGLRPGQLVIIGARPAVGKSTLALDFARACAITEGLPVAFFSLEMARAEITERLFSAQAKVALHHIRGGTVSDDDWERIAAKSAEVNDAPLYIDDSPNLTALDIRSKARRIKQRHGLSLIIVDYLQLMQSGGAKRYGTRQEEVADMSRNLKLLAKELEVPVVALSQLNRGLEQRAEKKPLLSDLRESGAVEQDADMVILLHREDAYEKESPRSGEADLIVAKHRGGPTATTTVAAQLHYSRFRDMAPEPHVPAQLRAVSDHFARAQHGA